MKKSNHLINLAASCLTLLAAIQPGLTMAQEQARPRSTMDFTRSDRLHGDPENKQAGLLCPSGQVLSGGQCVVISNQIALMCPADQVLQGTQNGKPVCVANGGSSGFWCAEEYRYVPPGSTCKPSLGP